jgi:tripartite-type tricarboxylate transporter receptor subunit TctC
VLGSIAASLPLVRAGDVRALAVLDERRSPLWPDVPTAAQAGVDGIVLRLWTGLMAPTGTPADAIGRLNRECNALLAKPSVRGWLVARGLDPIGGTPEAFDRTLRAEYARWGALAPKIGIRPQ